tara:strand:- start:293 stop:1531 length:1239 start_codon:yes stop_codon:yes gene_type:complete
MSKNSTTISRCQISGKSDLKTIISLGYLPPVNKMQKVGKKKEESIFFPVDLVYAKTSKLVQLNNLVNKSILFPKEYPYTSSTTKILRENFKELYKECSKLINLNSDDLIIDIGSNDGNLLNNFKNNHKVLGVTPENIGKIAIKKGIKTLIKYFDKKTSGYILKKFGKAKIITATNVFAHIENVNSLMQNILKILKTDGIFITESHYLVSLIKDLQYDTIYHEHLRYYSLSSLKYLLEKYNLSIFHAKKIPTHGGSIRVYAARKDKFQTLNSVKKILEEEKKFLNWKNFNKFRSDVVKSKLNLYKMLNNIVKSKQKIYGIGAPSRASTLINYLGLTNEILQYVCEVDGSYKIGNYMPGTNIPIISEKKLYLDQPEYALLLSWHISKELIVNLKKKGFKGKFIIPLPSPRITNK